MITNKSIDSNCKRIAMFLKRQTKVGSEEFDDIYFCRLCCVNVSEKLKADFINNKAKYIRKINKQIKNFQVKCESMDNDGILFKLDFEDFDPEFEDW